MSNLILNEQVQPYKAFEGKNTEQMPLLIKEGRVPLSVAGLMQRRLEVLNSNVSKEVKDSWWNHYFDTGDAPAYDTQGNMKVVLDAQPLRELTSKSELHNGALVLPQGTYAGLQGEQFGKDQLAQYVSKWYNKGESVNNPVWVALARGDKTLLAEYDTAAFARAKELGYDTAMGVFVASPQEKETMRLWCLWAVGYFGGADGNLGLDSYGDSGRLVGVEAPEAQVARKIAHLLTEV
ncbi:hypothetical protein HZB03_02670 [Candidatus Woesearchaeota archaeon]|nr:hypothetical protein [Candidatus Woesearchaeota archaeon]